MDNSSSEASYTPLYIGIGVFVFAIGLLATVLIVKSNNAGVTDAENDTDETKSKLAIDKAIADSTSTGTPPPQTSSSKVYTNYDSAWDYKKEGGVWFTHRKGKTDWISLASNKLATDRLNSAYPNT